jgi:Tol biopolymer transport system component
MPDDPNPQLDPNWSPDGGKLVFGGAYTDPNSVVRIFDLKSRQISTLPGSKGFFSAHWSPDGRYVVAMPVDSLSLALYDFQTQKCSELMKGSAAHPAWSADGRYVYFLPWPDNPAVLRVRISDRKVETVAELKSPAITGHTMFWFGLAPDDSPLVLRDTGTQDIYALDWEAP